MVLSEKEKETCVDGQRSSTPDEMFVYRGVGTKKYFGN